MENEAYELEVVIGKTVREELAKTERLSRKSRYVWPHDDTSDGTTINTEKLYFRPNYQDYSPV